MNARPATVDERCASLQQISNIVFEQSLILPDFQADKYISTAINKSGNQPQVATKTRQR